MKMKYFFYISIVLCLISIPFLYSGNAIAGNNTVTYIWVQTGTDHNASNANNWHWQSNINYGVGRIPANSVNSNIQFLSGNADCNWNLNGTFGDMYIGETYTGNITLQTSLTENSLEVESGKLIINNHILTITGNIQSNNLIPIFSVKQNLDIGMVIIVLACAIPFIGFIVHRFRKVEG